MVRLGWQKYSRMDGGETYLFVPLRYMLVDDGKVRIHLPERLHDTRPIRCFLETEKKKEGSTAIASSDPPILANRSTYHFSLNAIVEFLDGALERMTRHRTIRRPIRSVVEILDRVCQPGLGRGHG